MHRERVAGVASRKALGDKDRRRWGAAAFAIGRLELIETGG